MYVFTLKFPHFNLTKNSTMLIYSEHVMYKGSVRSRMSYLVIDDTL